MCSDIDYGLLRSNDGGEPPEGMHEPYLARAALVETDKGTLLVSEWQVPGSYYWTAWHGFAPDRIRFTQEYLDGLGVDRSTITDDEEFERALSEVIGTVFRVRTERSKGGYLNTYVEAAAEPDIPLPDFEEGQPAGVGAGVQQASDDDIPF